MFFFSTWSDCVVFEQKLQLLSTQTLERQKYHAWRSHLDTFHLEKHFPLRFRYPPYFKSGLMKVWFRPHVLLATDDSNIAMWWNDATCVMLWRPFQWNDLSLATSTPPKSNFFVGNSGILPVYSLKSFYHPGNESYIPPLQARKTIDWKVWNGKGYVIVPRRVNINDIPGVTWLRRYIYIYILL